METPNLGSIPGTLVWVSNGWSKTNLRPSRRFLSQISQPERRLKLPEMINNKVSNQFYQEDIIQALLD
jgi:hypothetical protein